MSFTPISKKRKEIKRWSRLPYHERRRPSICDSSDRAQTVGVSIRLTTQFVCCLLVDICMHRQSAILGIKNSGKKCLGTRKQSARRRRSREGGEGVNRDSRTAFTSFHLSVETCGFEGRIFSFKWLRVNLENQIVFFLCLLSPYMLSHTTWSKRLIWNKA